MLDVIKKDYWGSGLLWLPFGKAGTVRGVDGDYSVSYDDIVNPESISTLDGIPVLVGHPDTVISSGTQYQVGTCLGQWRLSADGLGGEVLAKITDMEVLRRIGEGELTETSPTYVVTEGQRIYNHIGLFPQGKARGTDMVIKAEGNTSVPSELLVTSATPALAEPLAAPASAQPAEPSVTLEPPALALSEGSYFEQSIPRQNGPLEVYPVNSQSLVESLTHAYQQQKTMSNPQTVEVTNSTDSILEILGTIAGKLEAFMATPVLEPVTVESETIIATAFAEGMAAGEVISTAKSHGFEPTLDKTTVDVVADAKRFVIKQAFAGLATEGFAEQSLQGAYSAALSHLATKEAAVAKEPVTSAPTVVLSEGFVAPVISRLKFQ
jgi:hypothetical protein